MDKLKKQALKYCIEVYEQYSRAEVNNFHSSIIKCWKVGKRMSKFKERQNSPYTLGDYDIWYKPCEYCGYDPGQTKNNRCWECGRQVYRDYSDRALKKSSNMGVNL